MTVNWKIETNSEGEICLYQNNEWHSTHETWLEAAEHLEFIEEFYKEESGNENQKEGR